VFRAISAIPAFFFTTLFTIKPSMPDTAPDTIKLDQFLKLTGIARTGGQAKLLVQTGMVLVNGKVETRRGRKLMDGDRVTVEDDEFVVVVD
jgi:ribosome-associated protein